MLLNAPMRMWSTLAPAGQDAAEVSRLFWIMLSGGAVIWSLVAGLLIYANWRRRALWSARRGVWLIVVGGVAVPSVVLAALLAYGMPVLAGQQAAAAAGSLRVHVSGEQWWWRIRYELADGAFLEVANELRLPLGQVTEVVLTSADVIHSFWVPSLAGKVDMIPGRLTRLTLEPTRAGRFRGVCAEYCGASHARMAFAVDVVEPADFAAWLAAQARPSLPDEAGPALFSAAGCASCHTIRGTSAAATIGPDLTHVGSRFAIGAGALPNTRDNLARWIADPHAIKPEVLMPPFRGLSQDDLGALASYLRELR
jgi:cytochrome c oxidase subunit II